MVLSNKTIKSMIDKNMLIDTSKSNCDVSEINRQINTGGIDLTIDRYVKSPSIRRGTVVYGKNSGEWDEKFVMDTISLNPGEVILACTREYINMPNDVCGFLFTKSSLGRIFVNHMMAGIVDAGFEGRLTLEFKNDGPYNIEIPVGARIVQMVVMNLDEAVIGYDGKYKGMNTVSEYVND